MQAIVQDRYGRSEVMRLAEIDRPTPRAGEVLVRVEAAAVDVGVWHLMSGRPYMLRLMGFGFRAPKSRIPGQSIAGTVEAVGPGVTDLQPGEHVLGWSQGAFAEYLSVPAGQLVAKPGRLTLEEAAVIPISGMTALQAIRDKAQVQPGQEVLITGAGGGVGTFAVQVAKANDATVTAVCRASKADLVRSIGADHVVDYARQDFTRTGTRYDAIIDTAGRRSLGDLRRALTPTGALVLVGGEGGDPWIGGFDRQMRASVLARFTSQRLRPLISVERRDDLAALVAMVEAGTLRPIVDRCFPLAEAAAAVDYLHTGEARGKVAISTAGQVGAGQATQSAR